MRYKKKRKKVNKQKKPSHSITTNNPDDKALQQDNPINNHLKLVSQQVSFSGPIPHPDLLQKYDQIIPNGADRIVTMAENQSRHRQHLEKWAVIGGTILSYVGVFIAGAIALFVSYYGYLLILNGYAIPGTIFSGVGLVGLVSAFIYGTRSRREERERKYQQSK
jgi:uncharacterized membrane protein